MSDTTTARIGRLLKGLRKRRPPADLPDLRLKNVDDVSAALTGAMNDVRSGRMSVEVGRAIAQICDKWLAGYKLRLDEQFEAKLDALKARQEELLAQRWESLPELNTREDAERVLALALNALVGGILPAREATALAAVVRAWITANQQTEADKAMAEVEKARELLRNFKQEQLRLQTNLPGPEPLEDTPGWLGDKTPWLVDDEPGETLPDRNGFTDDDVKPLWENSE